jgi:hypothetical protein
MITVQKLIERLRQFPGDLMVLTNGVRDGYEEICLPDIILVRHEPENMYEYNGEYQITDESDKDALEAVAIFRTLPRD